MLLFLLFQDQLLVRIEELLLLLLLLLLYVIVFVVSGPAGGAD